MTATLPSMILNTGFGQPMQSSLVYAKDPPDRTFKTSARGIPTPSIGWNTPDAQVQDTSAIPTATSSPNHSSGAATGGDDTNGLSPGTIAGISVGGVAAAFIAFLLFGLISERLRKRRLRKIIAEYNTNRFDSRWQSSNSGSVSSHEDDKARFNEAVTFQETSYGMHFTYPTTGEDYSGIRVDPNAIGVAVSSEEDLCEPARTYQRSRSDSTEPLLPAKPPPAHTAVPAEARAVEMYRLSKPHVVSSRGDHEVHLQEPALSAASETGFLPPRGSSLRKPPPAKPLPSGPVKPPRPVPPRLHIPMSISSTGSFQTEVSRAMSQRESQNTSKLGVSTKIQNNHDTNTLSANTASGPSLQSASTIGVTPVTKVISYYAGDASTKNARSASTASAQKPVGGLQTSQSSATTFDSSSSSGLEQTPTHMLENLLRPDGSAGPPSSTIASLQYPKVPERGQSTSSHAKSGSDLSTSTKSIAPEDIFLDIP